MEGTLADPENPAMIESPKEHGFDDQHIKR